MIRFLSRKLHKVRVRMDSWYHGSLLDRFIGWLLERPGREVSKAIVKPGNALDDLSPLALMPRLYRSFQRAQLKWSAWSHQSRLGTWLRVLFLPVTLLADLLRRLGRKFAALLGKFFGQDTPALVPTAVTKQEQRWRQKVAAWYVRKDMGTWLKAAPAMVTILGWLFLAAVVWWQNPARLEDKYTRWADDSQKMGNFPRARVASERLLQLGGTNQPAHILRLAKSLATMGFMEESLALAAKVASDQSGYNPARLFIAEAIVDNPGANSNALRSAEKHLLQAFAAEPESATAQALLGRYYFRIGDWEEARWHLQHVYPKRPEVALTLASLESRLGNELATVRWAGAAARHFQAETAKDPYNWRARLQWAEAVLAQGKATNALDILVAGLQRGESKALHRMAASIYTELTRRNVIADPTNIGEQLDWTIKGLRHEAKTEFLLSQLVRLSFAEGGVGEKANAFLRELARLPENRALVNFYQGMGAFMRADLGRARAFFDAAYMQDQDNAAIANNFAWILAVSEPAEPERSLKLINDIIQKYPYAPVFRETRGQIYARLGRWQEAATDLENALPYFKSNAVFRASLANVYAKLGKNELSAEHQQAAMALNPPSERKQP